MKFIPSGFSDLIWWWKILSIIFERLKNRIAGWVRVKNCTGWWWLTLDAALHTHSSLLCPWHSGYRGNSRNSLYNNKIFSPWKKLPQHYPRRSTCHQHCMLHLIFDDSSSLLDVSFCLSIAANHFYLFFEFFLLFLVCLRLGKLKGLQLDLKFKFLKFVKILRNSKLGKLLKLYNLFYYLVYNHSEKLFLCCYDW